MVQGHLRDSSESRGPLDEQEILGIEIQPITCVGIEILLRIRSFSVPVVPLGLLPVSVAEVFLEMLETLVIEILLRIHRSSPYSLDLAISGFREILLVRDYPVEIPEIDVDYPEISGSRC